VDVGGIADLVGPDAEIVLRRERTKALLPPLRVPAIDRKQECRHGTSAADLKFLHHLAIAV
jgi:hypothetical protein